MSAIRSERQKIHRLAFHAVRAALRATGSLPVPPLFILAHMRSGSTLLTHLLLTNPHIIGGGESHTRYHSTDDFDRLCLWTRWLNRTPLRPARFVADQIVHDDFTPSLPLLKQPGVHSLFLIREPQGSIASLVRFTSAVKRPWDVEKSTGSYIQRVNSLARHFENLNGGGRALCLTYEDLTVTPAATFQRLQAFLGLETGFSEQYAVHKFTGVRGDRSENIKAGRILRERPAEPVEIPPDLLEHARQAYTACLQTMKLPDGPALAELSNIKGEN